ncbi:ABC transporter ATP-binding protein [Pelagibacterium lentulum]|uniref:Sugar ABC transporter ATP-binding protein n=1 Tax=Pelagibacterium lentulum TaxID=2029865 RepID=A0A916W2Z4_9HYPH|nr:sn-glycerol-3-phosphate ABC transporter ATP-binding protein UgpC [Pelagibacterium lentulum]GGA61789.1 sugar ABC transporter ATP-binding protein [Pelagibacterium lentulum]
MASVSIENVTKKFGELEVIKGISVPIADGEFVILIGPSGCGKSTLLRMIAGLEEISGGTVAIDGKMVNNVPAKERDIAMVFQSYALYPHMTVRDNMAFSLLLRKARKAEIEAAVTKAAETLGLTELLDRLPRQLSGGQRQRVAMGRAIVRDPKVFLFDEPLSNLDAKLRVQMRTEIKALHQRLRATTVYVTHDQIEAMTMADKIVVMKDGHIEQVGTPLELYDNPANLFVAQFIGSPAMNILPARSSSQGVSVVDDLWHSVPELHHLPTNKPVTIGIRPEHFALADEGIPATIEVVEPTGAETILSARIESHPVTVLIRDRADVRPGDEIFLTPDWTRVHAFDPATGNRL